MQSLDALLSLLLLFLVLILGLAMVTVVDHLTQSIVIEGGNVTGLSLHGEYYQYHITTDTDKEVLVKGVTFHEFGSPVTVAYGAGGIFRRPVSSGVFLP